MKSKISLMWRVLFAVVLICSLGLVFAAPAAAAVLNVPDPYPTIQDAIDNADPYDTIVVDAAGGPYNEDPYIDVEGLTLVGLDSPVIEGSIRVADEAENATIKGFTIEPESWAVHVGESTAPGNVTIQQNTIIGQGAGGPADGINYTHSPPVSGAPGTVTDNTLIDCDIGIMIDHNGILGFTVTGNTVENARKAISVGSESDADIIGNTVRGSTQMGIEVFGAARILNNILENNAIGVWVSSDVTINWNNIVGNMDYGVWNDGPGFIDATNNWWNDPTGPSHSPGLGDPVSDYVDYCPWLGAPAPAAGPPPEENEVGPELEVVITAPTDVVISQQFAVTATVTNSGNYPATDVEVCLGLDGNAERIGGSDCYNVGDISPGSTQEINWTLHCTDEGDVEVTVTATDATCQCPVSETVTVHQPPIYIPPPTCDPDLTTTILPPPEDDWDICVCEDFDVDVKVENTGTCDFTDVLAELWVMDGEASPGYQNYYIGALAAGAYHIHTFTLHCDGAPLDLGTACDGHNYVDLRARSYASRPTNAEDYPGTEYSPYVYSDDHRSTRRSPCCQLCYSN